MVIEPHLLPTQAAYRPGRSTIQQILSLRQLIDVAGNHEMPLYALFIDFSAAFDSVRWDALEAVLQGWGVPPVLRTAVWAIIRSQRVSLKLKPDPMIDIQQGVLQGDTLAPFLFILIVDAVLRQLPEKGIELTRAVQAAERQSANMQLRPRMAVAGTILNHLAFADDIVLLAHSVDDARSSWH